MLEGFHGLNLIVTSLFEYECNTNMADEVGLPGHGVLDFPNETLYFFMCTLVMNGLDFGQIFFLFFIDYNF